MHRSALDAEVTYYLKRQEMERRHEQVVEMERRQPGIVGRLLGSLASRRQAKPAPASPHLRPRRAPQA
jgi:hypothetical protein